jgi:hypothetical protein
MDKNKKKIIAGAGVLGIAGVAALLLRRGPHVPPEPPPGEDYGRAQGYVLDAETSEKIIFAKISLDGVFQRYSDNEGTYYTDWVLFGPHTITVETDNYPTTDFPFTLNETHTRIDLAVPHWPEVPTEWTEGVEITKIEVNPAIIYLGQTINIGISIKYPYPLPLPADIHGSVLVDGTKLSGDWTIDFRNPTLPLHYTPTTTGEFLVRAQDKAAKFTVLQDINAPYYCPFGGTKFPVCTKLIFPDIAPFVYGNQSHPGGDFILNSNNSIFGHNHKIVIAKLLEKLSEAYPSEWKPSNSSISKWKIYTTTSTFSAFVILPLEYTCDSYWNSKSELAEMLATSPYPLLPAEAILELGVTCPRCNGTGIDPAPRRSNTCRTCRGLGKVLYMDVNRQLRDWTFPPYITASGFQGHTTANLYCPYCGFAVTFADTVIPRADMFSKLLNHIESTHPDHPLTEPAWF